MRLQNATSSFNAPLVYPPGIQVPAGGETRSQIIYASGMSIYETFLLFDTNRVYYPGAQCQVIMQALDLPVVLNANVTRCRPQLIDYLGSYYNLEH